MASSKNLYTIGFYNLENLFDTKNDPRTLDDDFTANSAKKWNEKRFRKKLKKLSKVITQIGYSKTTHPPVLLGVAEVENEYVLQELIGTNYLKEKEYSYVHFDSPDERGIDTALLYRKKHFRVIDKQAHTFYIETPEGVRDYTRDVLHVTGELEGMELHILVNHWPSRRSGSQETSYKRVAAAHKNRDILEDIQSNDPEARIVIMGDFNDDPTSESLQKLVKDDLYNPMEILHTKYEGSLNHRGGWNLFDQIIVTSNFLQQHGNRFRFETSKIFNPINLREHKGRYKGNPFRTFVGKKYLGGISDHFPVFSVFSIDSMD